MFRPSKSSEIFNGVFNHITSWIAGFRASVVWKSRLLLFLAFFSLTLFMSRNLAWTAQISPAAILPATVSMTYNPISVHLGQNSTLTITITNPNPSTALTGVAVTDNFPSGLQTHNLDSGCPGGFGGLTSMGLINATLPANSTCTVSAIIETAGASTGVSANTTTNITSDNGGTGGHATATLTILPPLPPSVSASFSPSTIALSQTSTYSMVLTNPNSNVTLTGVNVSDDMPAGVTLGSVQSADCGGTIDVSGNSFVIFAVTLPANSSCTVTATVTGATTGTKNNTTSVVNAGNAGNGNQATATLTVSCVNTFTVNDTGDTLDTTPGGSCPPDGGVCTLRGAIQAIQAETGCSGTNNINFNVTGTINLTSELPTITTPINFNGPGAQLLTIAGNNSFRLMNILLSSNSTMSVNDLSLTGGRKAGSGNAAALEFNNNGTLNVNRCEFFGNSGASAGAADGSSVIFSNASAALNLTASTIRNNAVEHAFEIGNTPFNIVTSTISNNTGTGAGIFIFGGVPSGTVKNSTIANNNQGIWHGNTSGTSVVTVTGTLLSQNGNLNLRRTPGGCPATANRIVSGGHNLIDDNSGAIGTNLCSAGTGDLSGSSVVAGLAALGNYGGTTQTRTLLPTSQALNAAGSSGVPTDQRGAPRPFGGAFDIGAVEMGPVVNSTGDGGDAAPGNGICETAPGNGICTLRAAIQEGTALGGNNIITFNVATPATISLGSSLPDITIPTSIFGPGANLLTISGNNTFRLLYVDPSINSPTSIVNINDLSFTGGRGSAGANAGVIEFNNHGTLNMNRCEFFGNSGPAAGAADGSRVIYTNAGGMLNLIGSTLRNNAVEDVIEFGTTPFNIVNSTISNNTGTGAGVYISGGVPQGSITNSTIANNNTGIWHVNAAGTSVVTIKNTLLSQNGNVNLRRSLGNCPATNNQIVSAGYNLIDDGSALANLCSLAPGDRVGPGIVAGLSPLGNYGGPTMTRAISLTSSALNHGDNVGAPATDQRGLVRPSDDTVDIGAFELLKLVVNDTGDSDDATPGDGVCETGTGNGICTLRAAIQESNVWGGNTIVFNAGGPKISLLSSLPDITAPVSIDGPGADKLTIAGNNSFRLLNVALTSNGTVDINDLLFFAGLTTPGINGAAIEFNDHGTLNINRCEFFGNTGSNAGTNDNSNVIYTNAASGININACTFRTNFTEEALHIGSTPFTLTNSTLSNNFGDDSAVRIDGPSTGTITNSTIADNNKGIRFINSAGNGSVTIKNSILSHNAGGNLLRFPIDCPGTTNQIISAGHNLIDDNSGPANLCTLGPGDLVGSSIRAGLASLNKFGGTTQTRPILWGSGSQAVDAGDNNGAPATDQRGVARPFNGIVDIGAYEASIDSTPTSLPSGFLNIPYPTTTLSATGGTAPYTFAIQAGALLPGLSLSSSGVLSGTPTVTGAGTFFIGITDSNGIKGVRSYSMAVNSNSPPSITAGGTFARSQGSNAFDTVATVSDAQDAAGSLTVTATSVPPGITVSNISNTNGSILARIRASCGATLGDNSVTLTVTDSGNLTATASFTVTVSANTPPSFAYQSNYDVALGDTINIFPPTNDDNGMIVSTVIQSHGTYTGTIQADPSTGFMRLSNATPAGVHTFTVRATDNCGAFTDASFAVTVDSPPPIVFDSNPASVPQNSSGEVVTIDGSDFTPGSVVVLNSVNHATTFISDTQLSFTLNVTDTTTVGSFPLVVVTPSPGGGTSNLLLFNIDPPNVCGSQSASIPVGQFGAVEILPGACSENGIQAQMFHNDNGSTATLYAATYTGNPTGTSIFNVGGGFVDLKVTNPAADTVTASFYYPSSITAAAETNLKLFFFNADHWQAVKSSGGADPMLDTDDNLNNTISGGVFFNVGFDNTSTPKISELTGTVFTFSTVATPTAVDFDSATVTQAGGKNIIEWRTGLETNNLGFNIYRQIGGERVKINPSLIAGTALMVGQNVSVQAGYSYNWTDDAADPGVSYWIEDVDLNGTTTWHGPFGVTHTVSASDTRLMQARSTLLHNLNAGGATIQREFPADFAAVSSTTSSDSRTNGRTPVKPAPISSTMSRQWSIASQPAIKIAINKSGWYHINMADLIAAGMNADVNPQTLQMFAGGKEILIKVNIQNLGQIAQNDSIEFYGSAIDTPTSDTQIYWLVSGSQTGKRIGTEQSVGSTNDSGPESFLYTVERKDRLLYFSSLLNGDAENWFGSVINTQPVSESLTIHHIDQNSASQATIEVALQGVTTNNHQVNVMLNGSAIETISFNAMGHKVVKLSIPQSSLVEGNNQITFAAQSNGDVSLIDYVRITYSHSYAADSNAIFASAPSAQPIRITGFTSNQIRAIDVVNPDQPIEVEGTIDGENGNYSIAIGPAKQRSVLAFTQDQMLSPLSITSNQPSSLNRGADADFVIITYKDFAQGIQPFAAFKQSQGYHVAVVDAEDIYDEFSYGVHTPQAIKDFLNWTYLHWPRQPQYVLLAGSGSLDPKNYTGLGNTDLVPVKLIDTSSMETASDDWFVDFDNDGKPQMSIGRLPVRTTADASDLISKIIAYEQTGKADSALLVSDISDNADFNTPTSQVKALIPSQMNVVNIVRGQTTTDARTELIDQFSQGGKVINYEGHGSVNLWRGNLLTSTDAALFTNQKASPLLVTMTCLNAYFVDPRAASLGEALLRVHQGGVVSVWASSAMTDTENQSVMNQAFFQQLFGTSNITLGQAIRAAKAVETNNDVRKTWILFGDPTMKIR